MLNRTRAILLRMQLEGQEPELLDLAVAKFEGLRAASDHDLFQ